VVDAYVRLSAASIRSRLQYRLSFALDFVTALLATLLDFVVILVIFAHVPQLGGWSRWEVGFLYGAAGISFGLADLMVGRLDEFGELIRRGSFDVLLVRPHGTLFQVVASEFAIRKLGKVAQAAAILGLAVANLQIAWDAARLLLVLAMIASGAAIFAAIWIGGAAIGFWTTEINEARNAFTYGGSVLTAYPIDIFGAWAGRFLVFVVPLAFVAYYPSLFVLGRRDALGGPGWLSFTSPLIAGLLLVVARLAWRSGVRHYRSTGS
jgi:ABC-2 type transport system permease protein